MTADPRFTTFHEQKRRFAWVFLEIDSEPEVGYCF